MRGGGGGGGGGGAGPRDVDAGERAAGERGGGRRHDVPAASGRRLAARLAPTPAALQPDGGRLEPDQLEVRAAAQLGDVRVTGAAETRSPDATAGGVAVTASSRGHVA